MGAMGYIKGFLPTSRVRPIVFPSRVLINQKKREQRDGAYLGGKSNKIRFFRKPCGSCPVPQGEALRSVQARRAAVTTGGPAPALPIPHMVGVLRSASAWCEHHKLSVLPRADLPY